MSGFDRSKRLLTPHQFQRVFKRSRRLGDDLFLLRVRYDGEQKPRLGLAISKKHAKLAVQRNRIKRQLREAFRHCYERLAPGDYVVVNRPNARTAPAAQLRQSAVALLLAAAERKKRQ